MHTKPLKLVTIIAERVLKDPILKAVLELGTRGYTLTDVSGQGTRGIRASEWEGPDVKIETIASPETADLIVEHIAKHYFAHHAVIVYLQDVDVVRQSKYL